MKVLNDKEIREFLNKHKNHSTDFVKIGRQSKVECFDCNITMDVRIAKSRVEILDDAEDNIEQAFRNMGF